jgi:hypothetical protein
MQSGRCVLTLFCQPHHLAARPLIRPSRRRPPLQQYKADATRTGHEEREREGNTFTQTDLHVIFPELGKEEEAAVQLDLGGYPTGCLAGFLHSEEGLYRGDGPQITLFFLARENSLNAIKTYTNSLYAIKNYKFPSMPLI